MSIPVAAPETPGPNRHPSENGAAHPSGVPARSGAAETAGHLYFWLALSLLFAIFCGIEGMRHAFQSEYVVQDDARTFLFWMERFFDPTLFPNDIIAAYFTAVSPPGYTALNEVAARVFGIDPFLLNKLLPIVLGVIMTVYAYFTALRLFRVPVAAFAAATILNESVWQADAIPSGTPRAFIYPIFMAFLFYSLRRQRSAVLCTVGLLGLFYPQMTTVALGTLCLSLLRWDGRRLRLSSDRGDWAVCISSIVLALTIVGIAFWQTGPFGPVITAAQARTMIEFTYAGRTAFFTNDWWKFWITGERSGMFPYGFAPPLIWLGVLLPAFSWASSRLTLLKRVSPSTSLLTRVALASFMMFGLAHAVIFNLHLPSRYTQHSLRMALALAAGIVLYIILKYVADYFVAAVRWTGGRVSLSSVIVGVGMIVSVASYPAVWWAIGGEFPTTQYLVGHDPELYAYLREQPKNVLIASLSQEADLLPSFAQRSILTGYEYGIPYHEHYYFTLRDRMHDLVRAQYTADPAEVKRFIQKYGVTHWLINRQAFAPIYVSSNPWIKQSQPEGTIALSMVESGHEPVLAQVAERCQVYHDTRFVLVDTACLMGVLGN